jgi:diguanylate cyclase (GGDEF)-like protein
MAQTLTSILSARQAISSELEELKDYLQVALDNMARGLAMFDKDQRLILCNRVYGEIYNLPQNLTRPGTALDKIIRVYQPKDGDKDDEAAIAQELNWIRREIALAGDGTPRYRTQHLANGRAIRVTTQPLPGGGWVDVQEDITEEHHKEAKLIFASSHDELTGLTNRAQFREHVVTALKGLSGDKGLAVHTVVIGSFQAVLGTYGLAARDLLVQEIGRRLVDVLRPTDMVARLDGDLFGIVQPNVANQQNIDGLRSRLKNALGAEIEISGHKMEALPRIGSVFAPRDGNDVDQLLNGALSMQPPPAAS